MSYNALTPQLATTWEGPDLPGQNFGNTDIAANLGVVVDTGNLLGGSVPGRTYEEIVGLGVKLPTAGSPAAGSLGLTRAIIKAGDTGPIQVRGVGTAIAAGSITAGNLLSICTTVGRVGRLQVAATGEEIIAQALNTASDGDSFPVRILSVSIHP
jgi:hypothetical protein